MAKAVKIGFIFTVLIFFWIPLESVAQNVFLEKYSEAEKTVTETYKRLTVLQELPDENGKIIYSLVAPEVAMYKSFLNLMETGAAEIFYTNIGGEYGNFSLGIFQMKPSFAEEVEKVYPKKCKGGKYITRLKYADTAQTEIRAERIERMKSEEWQQIYLICCYEILEAKYVAKFTDTRKKISFYAAAYNYGFNSTQAEIGNWQKKISFPGRGEKSIISYSELAIAFLELMVENISEIDSSNEIATQSENTSIAVVADTKRYLTNNLPKKKEEKSKKKNSVKPNNTNNLVWILFLSFIAILLIWKYGKKKLRK